MLIPIHHKTFEKEVEKAKKRGRDMTKLKRVMEALSLKKPLDPKHRNHRLKGGFVDHWECHIEPDWLLIYKKTGTHIYFARTGTHSDLF
jgi:mRNA interferase YafQ